MPPLSIEVATVEIDSLYDHISFATQIEGINNAIIQPRVDGFLISTHYQSGMPVKRGDLLFTIDPASFSTTLLAAQASLESARASEVLAQRNFERAEPLAAIDAISQSDLDQYRATYKAARATTKSAEESLRSAELEFGYTKIYAPIDGIAANSSVSEGDYIGPSTLQNELTTISQLDTITVELAIPTSRYLRHTTGSQSESFDNASLLSEIKMTLPDSSIYWHTGEYYYTQKDTPSSSSTVVIVAKFPNPKLELKEGMFARISANMGERKARLTVPKRAVSQLQGINSVWVIKPDSSAEWRKVTLAESPAKVWVISSGVEQGEKVAVSGLLKLHSGVKVAAKQVAK